MRPNQIARSRFTGGKGGLLRNRLRRKSQFNHSPYSGWRLPCRAYCFFAHNEFFRISTDPRKKQAKPAGPGSGLTIGASKSRIQPSTIITHWNGRISLSFLGDCLNLPFMLAHVGNDCGETRNMRAAAI